MANPYETVVADEEQAAKEANPYEPLALEEAQQAASRNRTVLDFALRTSPDKAAEANRLSRASGLPLDTVERNQEDIRRQHQVRALSDDLVASPVLRAQMAIPAFAAVAHDDVQNSKGIEQTITEGLVGFSKWLSNDLQNVPGQVLSTFGSSFRSMAGGLWGFGVELPAEVGSTYLTGPVLGRYDPLSPVAKFAREQRQINEQMAGDIRSYWGTKNSLLYQALESVWQSLATLPAGVEQAAAKPLTELSGNLVQRFLAAGQEVPIQTLLPLMAVQGGQSYGRAREQGVSPALAAGYALSDALIEGWTEQISLGRFVRDLKVGAPIWKVLRNQILTENAGEQVATALEDLNAWAVLPENRERTFGDYLAARPAAALDTFIQTTIATAVQTGLMGAASTGLRNQNRANQANQAAGVIERLMQFAEASKIRERDPESFQQFIAAASENASVQDVWVSPNVLMQSGVDVQAIAAVSPSFAEQLDEAVQSGGEVRIPVAELATALPGTGLEQAIIPHLRTDPEAMTQAEAQVFMQTQAEEFQREAETLLAERTDAQVWEASASAVEENIFSQLQTARRFTDDVNHGYAKLARAVFTSAAARLEVTPEEAFKQFALRVQAQGVNGAQYNQPPTFRQRIAEAVRSALGIEQPEAPVTFDAERFFQSSVMEQPAQSGDRGQISVGADITATPSIITLLQHADLSTFVHELGHFQLEVLSVMADTNESAARDMQLLLDWFGVADLATWRAMGLEEKRPYHEQLARGFEAYIFEGKAPSIELQGTFARLRAWLLHVYKNLTSLNVTLTDEVRGVFDRLLATKQQIADMQAQRGFAALFESAEAAGMSAEEWADYQSLGAQATEDATAEMQSRVLRNMQWLTNAKSRALKELQKDAASKRKAVEAEVRDVVRNQPVYAARRFLAYGELGPEVLLAPGEELTGKLDLGALKAMYGEEASAIWRYLPTGKNGLAASEGLHPDQVAELFGFTSGDQLVRELVAAAPEADVIESMTDQRMLERYGDLNTPESIKRAAEKAIHNEARAKFIATELRALERATGQRMVLLSAAREFAARTIARQLIRKLKPAQYAAAEARASKAAMQALASGDTVAAAAEKRNQLVNNYAAKAATEAAAAIERGVEYLKRFDREGTRKKINADYLDQIDAMLERFDLRTGQSLKAIDKRKSLAAWIKAQEDQGLEPAISDDLRDEAFRKHYKDLTVEEFKGVIDAVRNIEHLGRLKTKLLTAVRQREFGAAVDEIVASIKDNATRIVAERKSSDRGLLVDAGNLFRGFVADHRKFASLAREMDGWQDGGAAWEYLVRNMNKGGDTEAVMREQATVKLSELLKPILKEGGLGKKTYFPQIGKSFTREERIGIALNAGNETNRERVMSGENLTATQFRAILDTITPAEADFVQGVWDFLDSYRPLIAEKERRLTGIEPEWVQAAPLILGGKQLRGGYYPIAYDPLRSSRAEADTAAEVQKQIERGLYSRTQTRRGHLKERVESTGRPMRYDLGVIVRHVDQVVHDLAWHEFLIDANRLLNDDRIDTAIREHYGPEKLRVMKDILRDIAIGDMAPQGSVDRILNHLRHGSTIVGLGWRVTTSLLQPFGLTQSMVRIGVPWVMKGMRHWAGDAMHLENSVRLIGEKSDFMRLRAKTLQREINEIRNKVRGKDSKIEASYFYLIQKMQLVADVPTWWGAYEKAMATEADEARAIALADQAVIDAQGAGQIKDLSGVQRGSAGLKLFTTFYSFFNTTYQLTREAVGRTNFRNPASVGLLGVDLLLLYTIPAMLGTLMKLALAGDWDDEDKVLRRLLADQINYLTGTMVLVREGGGIAQNLIDPRHAYDYTGPASLRFFNAVSNLAKQTGQIIEHGWDAVDEGFWKALNEVGGTIFHYPAGQINATVDGINAMSEGKTTNPGALIVGHKDR